jgi:hypothetical protein
VLVLAARGVGGVPRRGGGGGARASAVCMGG